MTPSSQQSIGLGEKPMKVAQTANDSAWHPLVRGHRRYPVGAQMDRLPADDPGAGLREPPEASIPKWRHWVANLIARLKGC